MEIDVIEHFDGPQYKPGPSVLMQHMDDEVILVNLNTNHFYSLNRTASRFWELLCDGNQVDSIEQKLLSEFDIDAGTLRNEINAHLAHLKEKGLVCHADN